jgi:hypothetical protein
VLWIWNYLPIQDPYSILQKTVCIDSDVCGVPAILEGVQYLDSDVHNCLVFILALMTVMSMASLTFMMTDVYDGTDDFDARGIHDGHDDSHVRDVQNALTDRYVQNGLKDRDF